MNVSANINKLWLFVAKEKTPLALLVTAQAYVLFLWMVGLDVYSYPALTGFFAVITAVSLDSVVVGTTFSKHRNTWSWITSIVAALSGVMIALDLFYKLGFHWLHSTFPVLVFFYSQHLATERQILTDMHDVTTNKEELINKLIDVGLDNTTIYSIVGGNRTKIWKLINDLRNASQSVNTE